MSHFSVLAVITPEKQSEIYERLYDRYMPAVVGEDASLMESKSDQEIAAALIKASEEDREIALRKSVVGPAVAELLAPYQENNMGDCPEEFLEFNDRSEEIWEKVDEVIEEGSYFGDEYPESVGKTYGEFYSTQELDEAQGKLLRKRGFSSEEISTLSAFDLVACLYFESSSHEVEGERQYGYWHNPNSTWDWYQIGGRWSGSLYVKPNTEAQRGMPSLLMQDFTYEENTADVARIRDLAFERFEEETREKIETFWGNYQQYLKSGEEPDNALYGVHHTLLQLGLEWTNREEVQEIRENHREIDCARKFVEFVQSGKTKDDLGWFDKRFYDWAKRQADGNPEKDSEFLQRAREISSEVPPEIPEYEYDRQLTREEVETTCRWYFEWSTYAAVDDEGWHSKGEMGWFGMSTDDTADRENWSKSFVENFIRNRDPDTILAVVDCHV